jgi:Tfp pilus assembly protein PilX
MKAPRRQRGAALLIVIALFLIILPVALLAIFGRTLQNDTFSGSYLWRAQARDAANAAMASLRAQIAQSIGQNSLLEYQPSPPPWYIGNAQSQNPGSPGYVVPSSASFWSTCQTQSVCNATTVTLPNGTGRTQFQILQLVTPTGVIDPTLCNTQGYVAVFYNVWVQATATNNPAAGSSTTQAVYRACVRQG